MNGLSGWRWICALCIVVVLPVTVSATGDVMVLRTSSLMADEGVSAVDHLRIHASDIPASTIAMTDTGWQKPRRTDSRAVEVERWNGRGWLRLRFRLEPRVATLPLSMQILTTGASEVYLDGRSIARFGAFSTRNSPATTYNPANELISLDPHLSHDTAVHTLFVRLESEAYVPQDGSEGSAIIFGMRFGATSTRARATLEAQRDWDLRTLVPLGMIGGLCLLHLLVYVFDRRQTVHLLYSGFTLLLAGIILAWHIQRSTTDAYWFFGASVLLGLCWTGVIYVAMLLTAKLLWDTISRARFWFATAMTIATLALPFLVAEVSTFPWAAFVVIVGVDTARLTIKAVAEKKEGAWIIGVALLVFTGYLLTWFATVFLEWIVIAPHVLEAINMVGLLSMPVSMSILLARRMTRTAKDLEEQLHRVHSLTEENIAQERRALTEEIRRQTLELDNQRKTKELDEARRLQMSMLPTSMPTLSNVRISMAMFTATEVGGDFFDVYQHADDYCTIAIGDATGHGLKAGVMVATAKSHFQTHAHDGSHVDILQRTDAGIKRLRLRGMYMCLGLLTIKGHDVWWTAAGIPPVLHYRASDASVTPIVVKGLPLGSPLHVPIDARHCRVESGDVLLLMTDGLPELFNKHRETLGMDAIVDVLRISATMTANDLVSSVIDAADDFRAGEEFHDDVTIVAVTVM